MLDAERPTQLLDVAERLTFLQLDPTAVVAPAAELVCWTRLGNSFRPAELGLAAERDRTLWEHRAAEPDNAPVIVMLRPTSQLALHQADMAELRSKPGQVHSWLAANAAFQSCVLDQLGREGPLTSKDIPDTAEVAWKSSGWTNDRNVTQLLEFLASRGVVAVVGRQGKQRVWDLAEQVYPATEQVDPDDARRRRDALRFRALGVSRPKWVGDAGETIEIDDTAGVWRLDPGASADAFDGRTALLSPFDRLVHHYDRKRATDLFEFEYTIEFYKPAAARRWGYFVMPILRGDRLVGKVDVSVDRQADRLLVNALHEDIAFTAAVRSDVAEELYSLAQWLGMAGVQLP